MLKELKGAGSTYRANERRRRGRFLRLMIGIVLTIVIISAILGLAYVWYMGKVKPAQPAAVVQPIAVKTVTPVPVSDENAPVGVAIQTLTSPVPKGGNASISIKTRPQAACSIRVTYSTTPNQDQESKDGGLIPKTADAYGVAEWTWTVETSRPVGSWPVEVTCAYKTKWGFGKDMLKVID